jgi:sugar (pentulose or hexulose) kinase
MLLADDPESFAASDDACLVVSGKAMEANSLWRQMLADCTGRAVLCDEEASTESTSRGVAIMLALALGEANLKRLPLERLKPNLVSRPRAATSAYWKRLSDEQDKLLDALAPIHAEPDT